MIKHEVIHFCAGTTSIGADPADTAAPHRKRNGFPALTCASGSAIVARWIHLRQSANAALENRLLRLRFDPSHRIDDAGLRPQRSSRRIGNTCHQNSNINEWNHVLMNYYYYLFIISFICIRLQASTFFFFDKHYYFSIPYWRRAFL